MKAAFVVVISFVGVGCQSPARSHEENVDAAAAPDPLAPLREFEGARRKAADFSRIPSSEGSLGPDPIRIAALPHSDRVVGLLRGRGSLVVLDAALHEMKRLPAPRSPTGLAVSQAGDAVYVSGELSSRVARYRVVAGELTPAGEIDLGTPGIRDVALAPEGLLYALDEHEGRLITLRPDNLKSRRETPVGHGPFRLLRTEKHLVVDALLDHTLLVFKVDGEGFVDGTEPVRIRHDGPIWSFDAREGADGLYVAAGGVEDHVLDRTGGFFGWIDSFAFLYRVTNEATRLASVNVSRAGVITPKAVSIDAVDAKSAVVTVTGYGGEHLARLTWKDTFGDLPAIETFVLPPGTAAMTTLPSGARAFANPLLDAWVLAEPDFAAPALVPVESKGGEPVRPTRERVGEALFFTSLMAPKNRSDGPLSRFTCETCHFEGYIDGRTHHTGRGDVHATTKPLLGLFNNRPHFSRALDPDLSSVAQNEFRVASAGTGADPAFSVATREVPWLRALGVEAAVLSPEELRTSLMAFFMVFSHRPNPAVIGRAKFSDDERAGAVAFRDRCEGCHAARLASDDAATKVPFESWEQLVFAPEGALVWGRAGYEKTGILPYVHEDGARVPSLRRLYKKHPYFTNGSAPDLPAVVERARFSGGAFFHSAKEGEALSAKEQASLLAFLDLL